MTIYDKNGLHVAKNNHYNFSCSPIYPIHYIYRLLVVYRISFYIHSLKCKTFPIHTELKSRQAQLNT